MDKIKKFSIIKTRDKIYLGYMDYKSCYAKDLLELYFDGKKAKPSFHEAWVVVKKIPSKVEEEISQPDINFRYELKDKSFASDKIPLVIKRKDALSTDSKGYSSWKSEYADYRSLYEEKYDEQPNIKREIAFEVVNVIELEDVKKVNGFSYPASKTHKDSTTEITEKNVESQLLDKILFPNIVLPSRPSKLSSYQAYRIIRKHIQDNIDPKVAKITSDYDFCFSVCKKIKLVEPEEYKVNINYDPEGEAEYATRYRFDRPVKVFEMTYSPENYKGYTPIQGFEGKDHEDLKKNIDTYLKNLMAEINKPLKDCTHCKGTGVIID